MLLPNHERKASNRLEGAATRLLFDDRCGDLGVVEQLGELSTDRLVGRTASEQVLEHVEEEAPQALAATVLLALLVGDVVRELFDLDVHDASLEEQAPEAACVAARSPSMISFLSTPYSTTVTGERTR